MNEKVYVVTKKTHVAELLIRNTMTLYDNRDKGRKSSVFVLLMPAKQSLVRLYRKCYPACAVSVSARMRMTVLARWVRRVRVYPRFLHVKSLDFLLGEVGKGNRRVNERRRLSSGINRVRALSGGRLGWEEVDALQCAVFVHS
jgi:hypothetical protein